jgi:casein kinase 1
VNIPIGTPQRTNAQHPYANPGTAGYDYGREVRDDAYGVQQHYGRASPMVSSVGAAPPAISNVRAHGGNTGVSHTDGYNEDVDDVPPKSGLLRILTCRC